VKKKRQVDKSIIFLIIILLIILVSVALLLIYVKRDKIEEKIENEKLISMMISLHDGDNPILSEVFLYNPGTYKGAIIDIPNNVGVLLSKKQKYGPISDLYSPGSPDAYVEKIEKLINSEINYYIDLSIPQLKNMVDLLEGFQVFITNPLEKEKEKDGLPLLIPSGSVVLDGDKIVDYISYTSIEDSDIIKVGRRQKITKAFLERLGKSAQYVLKEDVLNVFYNNILTNLSKRSMGTLVDAVSNLNAERVVFQRVLGVNRSVDGQQLLYPHYEGQLLKRTVEQTIETIAKTGAIETETLTTTLEVLNGTHVNGLASRTAELFESYGYEIAAIANADNQDYENTQIVDRKGNIAQAEEVARVIKCTRVKTERNPELDPAIDVTVILGKDYDGRYCQN